MVLRNSFILKPLCRNNKYKNLEGIHISLKLHRISKDVQFTSTVTLKKQKSALAVACIYWTCAGFWLLSSIILMSGSPRTSPTSFYSTRSSQIYHLTTGTRPSLCPSGAAFQS